MPARTMCERSPDLWFLSACHVAGLGKPDFKLEVSKDKKKTTLFVTEPLTALFKDGRQLTLRDIFTDKLMYKVMYRKNKSTGKVSDFTTYEKASSELAASRQLTPGGSVLPPERARLAEQRDRADSAGPWRELLLQRPGVHPQPSPQQAAGGGEPLPVLRGR